LDGFLRMNDEEVIRNITEVIKNPEDVKTLLKKTLTVCRKVNDITSSFENKKRFFSVIRNIAELVTEQATPFYYSQRCPRCDEEVILSGKTEKGITDMRLSNDMIYHAGKNSYNTSILISGDGHYQKPLEYVKDMGKKVVVAFFERNTSENLRKHATEFVSLNEISRELQFA